MFERIKPGFVELSELASAGVSTFRYKIKRYF